MLFKKASGKKPERFWLFLNDPQCIQTVHDYAADYTFRYL
jgi:hypothetical protein